MLETVDTIEGILKGLGDVRLDIFGISSMESRESAKSPSTAIAT